MTWHVAAIWDLVARTVPDALAVVQGERQTTWRAYEDRAARLAAAMTKVGVGPGSKVAIYGYNSAEWLEAHYAAFKARAAAANVNYRYTESELAYLVDNSDAEVLVFDAQFGPRVAAILDRLPKLRLLLEIADGSGLHLPQAVEFERAISENEPLPKQEYAGDDLYMLYTGGTTGLPKGVLYRQDVFARLLAVRAAMLAGEAAPASCEELGDIILRVHAAGAAPISIPACPLMHGTGLAVGVIIPHNLGGCAVMFRNQHFDGDAIWRLTARHRATDIAIVGDAFAKPLVTALELAEARGSPYDVSSLKFISSAGVMFSHEAKLGLLRFADVVITDMISASEAPMGYSVVSRRTPSGQTGAFIMNPGTKVFNEHDEEVAPGSDEIGMVAAGAMVPIGYHGDQAKSDATFRTVKGVVYAFPGDYAKVAADGGLILLGRGSNCINTGGEKVFPEEVEEVLKLHEGILDCLIVGVPDDRFGQRMVAVVSAAEPVNEALLIDFARTRLAGYKIPRQFVYVSQIARGPNGKADYKWARTMALDAEQAAPLSPENACASN